MVIKDVLYVCDAMIGDTCLTRCEEECVRYYQCDNVAIIQDVLKELEG